MCVCVYIYIYIYIYIHTLYDPICTKVKKRALKSVVIESHQGLLRARGENQEEK
jgi:hypothetical protein